MLATDKEIIRQLKEEKQFKETLLGISEAVAQIQDRKELLKTILDGVKPIFGFYDVGLFVFDGKGNISDWATVMPEISESEVNRKIHQSGIEKVSFRDSALEAIYKQVNERPIIFPYSEEFFKRFPDDYQWDTLKELGYQESLFSKLTTGGKTLGMLSFNSTEPGFFQESQFPLFQAIADQLAVAVSNVLANEALIEEKQLTEKLLGISEALVNVSQRDQLFQIITEKIGKLLPMDDLAIIILNEDKTQWKDISIERNFAKTNETTELLAKKGFNQWQPLDSLVKRLLVSTEIMTIEDYRGHNDFPSDFLDMLENEGLIEFMHTPLKMADEPFGALVFDVKVHGTYSEKDFPLFQAIAHQLAVAVSNVLANERLVEEKQLTEKLLGISEALVNVSQRNQLFHIITEKIGQLLPMDDLAIVILNEDKTQWKDISIERELIPEKIHGKLVTAGFDSWLDNNSLVEKLISTTEIMTIDDYRAYKDFPVAFLNILEEDGLLEYMHTPLRIGNEAFGSLIFDSKETGTYTEKDFPLFQAIADQLAVAVSNVLANEALIEEKQFKETLLIISEAVASIKDRKELFEVIFERIKPIFNFYDIGLFVLNDSEKKLYDWSVRYGLTLDSEGTEAMTEDAESYAELDVSEGSFLEWVLTTGETGCYVINLSERAQTFPIFEQTKLILDYGYQDCLISLLKNQGKTIGFLCLNSLEKDFFLKEQFPLFQAIADQLAVAVSNVLANEALITEKKKTEDLLAVTESIANITSGPELIRAIFKKLHRVFPFDEIGLFHLDFENERERDLTVYNDYNLGSPDTKHNANGLLEWMPIRQCTTYLSESLIIEGTEIYEQLHHPPFKDPKNRIFKQIIAGPLKQGDQIIGMLCFWSKKENAFNGQQSLFKSISDQVGVALSNIIANENIEQREREKALQLQLTSALDTHTGWHQNFKQLIEPMQRHLDATLVIVTLRPDNGQTHDIALQRIAANEYRYWQMNEFNDFIKLTKSEYQSDKDKTITGSLSVGEDFEEIIKKHNMLRKTAKTFKLKSMLYLPLQLTAPGSFDLTFFSPHENGYSPQDEDLLNAIKPSLELALERLMAFEEIEHLNKQLKLEKEYLEEEVAETFNFGDIIGESDAMQKVYQQIEEVAGMDTTVFIQGETGTGKELVARAIHKNSPRKDNILVKVNCAAIPKELVESELFGHEKGAFTGALKARVGKFELAHKGTIFLDEVGELPLDLQAKLLRVLQEKEVERLGGNKPLKIDFRLIAATNRDLQQAVADGDFRTDLFYRLFIYPIQLPPLKQRGTDVIAIAEHFARTSAKRSGLNYHGFTDAAKERMLSYPWPGNVRELENVLQQELVKNKKTALELLTISAASPFTVLKDSDYEKHLVDVLELPDDFTLSDIDEKKLEFERQLLLKVLEQTKWRVSGRHGAAALLDVKAVTLEYRMRKLGINRT